MEDITPADSVVPVYLVPFTEEEIAEREAWAAEAAQAELDAIAKAKQKAAILERIGLTEEELTIVLTS